MRLGWGDFNQVGGQNAGEVNTIAFNDGDGISVHGGTAEGNTLRGNVIYSNDGLAIDLNEDGVSANDTGDIDGDANGTVNFAVMTSASFLGNDLTVDGTYHGEAGVTVTLDFYKTPVGDDDTVHGEALRYLGLACLHY